MASENLTSLTDIQIPLEMKITRINHEQKSQQKVQSSKKKKLENKKVTKKIWLTFKYDTLNSSLKISTNIKIQFPSLFTFAREEKTGLEKKEKNSKASSILSFRKKKVKKERKVEKNCQISNISAIHYDKKKINNTHKNYPKEIFSAKVGTFFLKYKKGIVGGIKNYVEMKKKFFEYNLSFSIQPEIYFIKSEKYTHWLNKLDVTGKKKKLFYNWNLYTDWYFLDPHLEIGTRFTFHDTHFSQLNFGLGAGYSTNSHVFEYRFFLYRNFYHWRYLKEIGGHISHIVTKTPFFYTYKVYLKIKKKLSNHLIISAIPYLLYSKEYNFNLKPAIEIKCKYLF